MKAFREERRRTQVVRLNNPLLEEFALPTSRIGVGDKRLGCDLRKPFRLHADYAPASAL
jgi:hypothetical protein